MSGYSLLLLPCFREIPVFNVNSVDPDQTPHSVASDLDLHCLQITIFEVSRLKWVKWERGEKGGSYLYRSRHVFECYHVSGKQILFC